MNIDTAPSRGLRNVLIYVNLGGVFPPPANSAGDVALLRAANLAMRRKAQGVTDICLFLIAGATPTAVGDEGVNTYGFPVAEIVHVGDEKQEELTPDYDALQEEVGQVVASWLTNHHPGAIAYPRSGYDATNFWWVGVEHEDNVFEWPFSGSDFASELPDTHKEKAETWLTILAHALDLETTQASTAIELGQQRAAVAAATLCEWLHGFEAASGNGYNHFDPDSAINSLGLADLFLGFEASCLSGEDLDEFCDEHDVDIDGLGAAALSVITGELRGELRSALSSFFGSDSSLFWALHSAIWPQFCQPMGESINALLNQGDIAELEAPWSFVTDGWCEAADQ